MLGLRLQVMKGFSKEGPVAYHIDVKKVALGWNVLIHRGPDTDSPVIMKLFKKKALWDKNTQMIITVDFLLSLFGAAFSMTSDPWP